MMPLSAYRFATCRATTAFPCRNKPRQRYQHSTNTRGGECRTHVLALVVQLLIAELPARRAIPERIKMQRLRVRTARGERDDARVVVWRGCRTRDERGHEQLGEVEVAHDGRAELQVVSVVGELVDRRCQDSSACGVWNPLWGLGRG